mgnify:CR=1 FL=1
MFEVVGNGQRLGQGGRYDELLSVYDPSPNGKGFPGVGFVLDIELLHRELVPGSYLPKETPPSDWLIVPEDMSAAAAALAYAQKARQSASANVVRVELSLDLEKTPDEVRAIARKRNISRIAWISEEGLPDIELVN